MPEFDLVPLELAPEPPRALTDLPAAIDPRRGLRTSLYLGLPFLAAGIACPLGAVLLPLPDAGVRVFLALAGPCLFLGLGLLLVLPPHRRMRDRQAALEAGFLVSAEVVEHGRAFVAWKSWRDYTLHLRARLPNGKERTGIVQTSTEALQSRYPVGSVIKVLVHPDTQDLFCAAELGFELRTKAD